MIRELAVKAVTPLTILIEAYRVFNGALLVIFVPGVCNGKACLPQENFMNGSTLYRVVCGFNLITLVFFLVLYSVEIHRENRLNKYLVVNPDLPTNNDTVNKAFSKLTQKRQNAIHTIDKMYKTVIYSTIGIFTVNTLLSGYIIFTEYAEDKGPILFATGTVLIASKMYSITTMCSNTNNIYTSAYIQKKIQFNDLHPSYQDTSQV